MKTILSVIIVNEHPVMLLSAFWSGALSMSNFRCSSDLQSRSTPYILADIPSSSIVNSDERGSHFGNTRWVVSRWSRCPPLAHWIRRVRSWRGVLEGGVFFRLWSECNDGHEGVCGNATYLKSSEAKGTKV